MYQVKELAKLSSTSSDAVRYYTRLGLLNPVRDPKNKYKKYSNKDLKRLKFIHLAKHLGYVLNEIAQIFEDCEKSKSPCPKVRKIIERRIDDNRKLLEQQMKLQIRMEKALKQWKKMKDGVPNGETICLLIESFDNG